MTHQHRTWFGALLGCAAVAVTATCTDHTPERMTGPADAPAAAPADTPAATPAVEATAPYAVLVGAGDIASCSSDADNATGRLLDGIPGTVFTAGDNAYSSGTATQFSQCYGPSWGRHKWRTRPSPGNHDYKSSGAAPYYSYYGTRAGPAGRGYYSYNLGAWHVISLNSNVSMSSTSAQVNWLKADLAANPRKCTLAYWHHPRFSSGRHGNTSAALPLWQALYNANADVIIGGHDHDYERFAPQTPNGTLNYARGIRQFVVGTGGADLRAFSTIRPNSWFRYNGSRGVLKLILRPSDFTWYFIARGNIVKDSGTRTCH